MILLESLEAVGSTPFFVWLMDQLRALAELRTPVLTAIMSAVTYLGHEMAFLVVAMILAWCADKRFGYRFLAIFMIGSFLQQALKAAFMIPRPWIIDPTFAAVESAIPAASGYSFPSGHTMTACLTLGGTALFLKKKWAYALAVFLTLIVAFSRMYLGVHTLLDVAVGLLLGVAVLAFFAALFRKNKENDKLMNVLIVIGCVLSVGLLVILLIRPMPDDPANVPMALESIGNAYVLAGASLGLLIGKLIEDHVTRFDTKAVWWVQILKVAIGLGVVLAVRAGLKIAFGGDSETALLRGVRYFAMTVIAIGVYPLLFRVLCKLSHKKEA